VDSVYLLRPHPVADDIRPAPAIAVPLRKHVLRSGYPQTGQVNSLRKTGLRLCRPWSRTRPDGQERRFVTSRQTMKSAGTGRSPSVLGRLPTEV